MLGALVALAVLLPASAIWAQDKITVATGQDFRPFEFVDEDGKAAGLVVDLWKLWSEKTGIPIEFKPAPWSDTLKMMQDGRADIHAGLNLTEERQKFLDYGEALLSTNSYVFSPAGMQLSGSIQQLTGFRIGVLKGSLEESVLSKQVPGAELVPFKGIDELYDAILANKVRLFADVEQTGLFFLNQRNLVSNFRFDASAPLDANHLFAAVAKGKTELLEKVNAGMGSITPRERAQIVRRWLNPIQPRKAGTLVIAMSRNYPPFTLIDANGQPAGMLVDIWRLWAKKTGRKIEFRQSSWADTLNNLGNDDADVHSGLFQSEERSRWIDFSRPIYEIASSYFHRTGASSPKKLSSNRIGVVAGSFQESYIRKNYPTAKIISLADDEELIRALADGRLDTFLSEDRPIEDMLGRLGMRGRITRSGAPILKNELFFGVRKGEAELLALIEKGLDEISTEELAEIEGRWVELPENRYFAKNPLAFTAEERAWLAANPVIRVHNEMDWPPFNFNRDGKPQGFSIDYMNLLAAKVGVKIEFISGPTWSEFLGMMKKRELDVMLNIVRTPDRLKYMHYTRPYIDNPNTITSRKDQPYDNLEQLFGKTISVPKGFFYEEILKRNFPQIKLHLVKNTLEALKAVTFGKADAAVGELAVLSYLMEKHFMTDLVLSGEVKLGSPEFALLNISARQELPILASILDKGVKSMDQTVLRKLRQKWLGGTGGGAKRRPILKLTKNEREWLSNHKKVRLGIDRLYPPFEFVDENGTYSGMASDYVKLISERLGITMEVVPGLLWEEVLDGVKKRTIDVLPAAIDSPERKLFVNFSNPHMEFPIVIVTRDKYPFVAGLNDLNGKVVALTKGYAVTSHIETNYPVISRHLVDDPLNALRAVAVGEAEAAVLNLAVATFLIEKHNLANLKVAAPADIDLPGLSFAVRKDWPLLVGIFNKTLASISPEEKSAIRAKWISVRYEHTVDRAELLRVALTVGGIALVIVLIIVAWNRRLGREIRNREAAQRELANKESLLRLALDQMSDGLYQLDEKLRFTLFNDRYKALLGVPDRLIQVGEPADGLLHYLAERGDYGEGEVGNLVQRRIAEFRNRDPVSVDVNTPGGHVEFRQTPTADGGVVVVASDITERKRAEEILRTAKEEAEASAQAKSDFIAEVSHEVRTPMNGVLGMARLMLESPLSTEQREFAQTIVYSGEALMTILNDLLDISKLEAGKLDLEAIPFAPRRLVEDAVNVMASRAKEKALNLRCQVAVDVPEALIGDANRLRQILFNLLSNAIKFTDEGDVTVELTGNVVAESVFHLGVSVTDSGVGIAPEVAEKLFAPYVQAAAGVAREYGGTGLGLSICRRLADLMGGAIDLESKLGAGSTFTLTAPFEITDQAPSEMTPESFVPTAAAMGAKLRVLLVEDNLVNRKVAVGMVSRMGHEVAAAEHGREALQCMQEDGPFDAILMDRHMPVMDGIEATKRIRAMDGDAASIPIIALTAAVTPREVETCLDAGMNSVVTKPVDPVELAAALAGIAPVMTPEDDLDGGAGEAPVLDRRVLDKLRAEFDADMVAELIDDFRRIAPEGASGFLAAAEADDQEAMMRHAHDLKSSAATIGLMRLSGLCREMELACAEGLYDEARDIADDLRGELERALQALAGDAGGGEADAEADVGTDSDRARFLAKMSHDLRNTMNTSLGYIMMLHEFANGGASPEEMEDFASELHESGVDLLDMTDDILTLFRIETERYKPSPEAIGAAQLVRSSAGAMEKTAAGRGVDIAIDCGDENASFEADGWAAKRMLANLLANAVLASPEGGTVAVSLDGGGGKLAISVADQGPGISAEEMARAESPYGRVWEADGRRGLPALRYSTAHRLAGLNGGSLNLGNGPDGGTVAVLEFPAQPSVI
ncbi:MAG: transporter substrate-binding domain-containing protein [Rhodospirillales bacterium]|jgi:ABC-type amino acid transport substrate-binding protein/signal transduction histidine kinase|nr:transporter substrate-binding domain-containing protein [Rhodospirillales bacterium]MDP6644985.1 transporter substrate-binding domain-containing protein [Rhodospirillales bacterium]MDP6840649.1 transporter substrate-binding domain-containing protein [Rhodospirillales bacterium]